MTRRATGNPPGRPKGSLQSDETRAKISAAKKGQRPDGETRNRMSAAHHRRLADPLRAAALRAAIAAGYAKRREARNAQP